MKNYDEQQEKLSPSNNFLVTDEQVKEKLDELESDTLKDTGVHRISGGFARAEILDYDIKYFYITLKWGVQSDCENNVHTEHYKLDRLTLEIYDE